MVITHTRLSHVFSRFLLVLVIFSVDVRIFLSRSPLGRNAKGGLHVVGDEMQWQLLSCGGDRSQAAAVLT